MPLLDSAQAGALTKAAAVAAISVLRMNMERLLLLASGKTAVAEPLRWSGLASVSRRAPALKRLCAPKVRLYLAACHWAEVLRSRNHRRRIGGEQRRRFAARRPRRGGVGFAAGARRSALGLVFWPHGGRLAMAAARLRARRGSIWPLGMRLGAASKWRRRCARRLPGRCSSNSSCFAARPCAALPVTTALVAA